MEESRRSRRFAVAALFLRFERFSMREWLAVAIAVQLLLFSGYQLLLELWPESRSAEPELEMTSRLDFIEYQEIQAEVAEEAVDLSDTIIETEKKREDQPRINWESAADPAMDFDQRYVARLQVNISPDDYPDRARRANTGTVVVAATLYITAEGRIRDVRIRNIRSPGGTAEPFRDDFVQAVRRILMQQTRLVGQPYRQDGVARDFVWDTTVTFQLQ